MASTDVAVQRGLARPRLLAFLEREGLVVAVVSAYVVGLAYRLPSRLQQDAWVALVGGRQVVRHGIPTTDTLTYWTAGRHWIDQQWLAQAASYLLYSAGGLKLFALTHVVLSTLALVVVMVAARRRGASPRAIAWLGLVVSYLLALAGGHVRTQSFAYPLFALVLALLLDDARHRSRRVLLVLPLLVLWANVHGSVVLGAALTCLYGVSEALRGKNSRSVRTRGGLLAAGAAAALVATPWFLGTVTYYRSTLFNSAFRNVVSEWRSPTLSLELLPFFVLAAAGLWLLGRCPRRFSVFDRLALGLLVLLAFEAQRNIVWLALGAIPLLAPALDDVLPETGRSARAQANAALAAVTCVLACLVFAGSALRPQSAYTAPWPVKAAGAVARAAKVDPTARIYANERYADWLLMAEPRLAGRIAYDARFELLTQAQLTAVSRWRNLGANWRDAARQARVIVLALPDERASEAALLAGGARILYRDRSIAVLERRRGVS